MKSRSILAALLFTLFSTLLLASCSKNSNSDNGGNGNGGNNGHPSDSTTNAVTIANMAYSPSNLTVKAGTTVTWTNNDDMQHTVTADDGSFASSRLNKGGTYSHTFSTAGTYPYHCEIHPFMKATVIAN